MLLGSAVLENPEKWRYKVAELTCMEVEYISNEYSLRHAKIVQFRDDKKAEDCDFSQISDKA